MTNKHNHPSPPISERDQDNWEAEQRLRPVTSEWQPIETAPVGTMLLFCSIKAQEARDWCFVDWRVDGRLQSGHARAEPTHWMPLPAPPK